MNILLYIHQLPQNIIGLILVLITKASSVEYSAGKESVKCYRACRFNKSWSGVSLGKYIVFSGFYQTNKTAVSHEYGHQRQSLHLGWLYLILIGLPSFCGNIWDRLAHKKWSRRKRIEWYYKQPWEQWADKIGGVERN